MYDAIVASHVDMIWGISSLGKKNVMIYRENDCKEISGSDEGLD